MKNTLPCPEWRELLSAHQDQQLSLAESRQVADHLTVCTACRETLAQWETDRARFIATYAASTGGAKLRSAILEELRMNTQQKTPSSIFSLTSRWRWGIAVTAAIGILLTAGVMTQQPVAREQARQIMARSAHESVSPVPGAVAAHPTRAPRWSSQDNAEYIPIANGATAVVPAPTSMKSNFHNLTMPAAKLDVRGGGASVDLKTDGVPTTAGTNAASFPSADSSMGNNYGIPGGVKMAFTVNYALEVKNALHAARSAQESVKRHGGFSVDFQYSNTPGELPCASFHGKIRAEEAVRVLDEIEKLGNLRSANIQGKDITQEILQQQDQLKHEKGIEATETFRNLQQLALQHDLVDLTATFTEPQPRVPLTFESVRAGTLDVLGYALQAFITLAMIFLLLLLIASPVLIMRHLRRQTRAIGIPAPVEKTVPEEQAKQL